MVGLSPVSQQLSSSIAAMRQPISAGNSRPRRWRLEQLERLEGAIAERRDAVLEALARDLSKPPV